MEINEKILRITGSVSLEKEIKFGEDIEIIVRGALVKTELKDNNDGTFDKVYKVKMEEIVNEGEKFDK